MRHVYALLDMALEGAPWHALPEEILERIFDYVQSPPWPLSVRRTMVWFPRYQRARAKEPVREDALTKHIWHAVFEAADAARFVVLYAPPHVDTTLALAMFARRVLRDTRARVHSLHIKYEYAREFRRLVQHRRSGRHTTQLVHADVCVNKPARTVLIVDGLTHFARSPEALFRRVLARGGYVVANVYDTDDAWSAFLCRYPGVRKMMDKIVLA